MQGSASGDNIFSLFRRGTLNSSSRTVTHKGVTVLRTKDGGKLRGLILAGGEEVQRDGIPGIERQLGIMGTAALGQGMEQPIKVGVDNLTIQELSAHFDYDYDPHTGLETLSLGFEKPYTAADFERDGTMKGSWDQNRFAVGVVNDPSYSLRAMAGAFKDGDVAICLSDPDGRTGAVHLGIFWLKHMSPEQKQEFEDRDRMIVESRHALIQGLATRDGSSLTDMPSAVVAAEPANDAKVA